MANMQSLKRRIKSAKNIKQITKAMEMVAASKMRRAQTQALSSRAYARKLESTLATIATLTTSSQHPLLESHAKGTDLIVIFSTDKSLAGSLNTNLFRGIGEFLKDSTQIVNPHFCIIGSKAKQFVVSSDYQLDADFSGTPDPINFQTAIPIASFLVESYLKHTYRTVTLMYMDFISTLVQEFRALPLLPFSANWSTTAVPSQSQYLFEPSPEEILDWLLPYYIEMIIFQTLLETKASEHSARMVAMKNASDNATEIISDLTLMYNKQRQAKITNELLDNTAAALVVV